MKDCVCQSMCWIDDPTACGDPEHCPQTYACYVCNPTGLEDCAQHR